MAIQPIRLGESFLQGRQQRIAEDRIRQQMEMDAAREAFDASIRPIRQAEAQYGLRGQILGTVETPEDYRAALGEVSRLNLPTGDLPEDKRSTAWMTFKAPGPAQVAPSWMPAWAKPAPMLPASAALPSGEMSQGQIAPEDIPRVQRAAERGLPLVQQSKMREAEANRGLRGLELDSRAQKYATQLEYADRAAQLADRRMNLQESAAERTARIEREKLDIARQAATSAGTQGEAVKLAIKDIPVFRDEARTALSGIKTLDQMKGLLDAGAGARPGQIKVFLSRLTGQQTESMADAEVYQLLAETLRGPLRTDIVGPGPMTESEQRLLGQVTGGGTTGSKAAARLLDIYRESATGKIRNYNETRRRVGQTEPSVLRLYEELQIPGAGGQAQPTASPYKFTKSYQGATYGRNSDGESWKLVK
jgi:hypothetical protein